MSARDFAHLQPDNAEVERAVLAQEVETLRNRIGLRQVDVSKECGVNASMLSQWMLGRYKGNVSRINGLMESWLIRRRGGKPMEKGSMNMMLSGPTGHSPKLKRRLEELTNPATKDTNKIPDTVLFQRKVYDYPKHPPSGTLLIPIRIDVDVDGYRYIDSFSWNLYERDFTFESFADTLVRDLDLPTSFRARIASQINAQVEKSKRSLPWHEAAVGAPESLHPIFINIRINDTILIDRFEWDLCNATNSPEVFAQVLCAEMGLSGEFEAQVALTIREQLRDYSRLMREGLRDRVTRLPPVTAALRDRADAPSWEPTVKFIVADDIPLLEREDFKRMRVHSHSTVAAAQAPSAPTPIAKANRPPKPVNTFLMFCREWRKKIMTENANTSAKDASKILGEMWQKLSDQQRASYIPMTEKENQRRLNEWRVKENLPIPPAAAKASATKATTAGTRSTTAAGVTKAVATVAATAAPPTTTNALQQHVPAPAVTTATAPVATTTKTPVAPVGAITTSVPSAPNGTAGAAAVVVGAAAPVAVSDVNSLTDAVDNVDNVDDDQEESVDDDEEEEGEEEEEEEDEIDEEDDDDVDMDDDAADVDTDSEIPIDVDMILDGVDLDLHM